MTATRTAGQRYTYAQMRACNDILKINSGCVDCGYHAHARALEWDHIDPTTKHVTRSGNTVNPSDMLGRYSMDTFLAEIAKCVVRCANCHAIRSADQRR